MTKRTALLSTRNLGALDAYREILRTIDDSSLSRKRLSPLLDVDILFGGTMVQSGVDRFLVFEPDRTVISSSQFINKMTDTISLKGMEELYWLIHNVVGSQTIQKPKEKELAPLSLVGFLIDLIIAARYRTLLVLTLPMPDLDVY